MSRLSIIIPVLGNERSMDETLVSVLENRPEETQIVLACPHDYADPYALADEVDFAPVDPSHALMAMANVGLEHAQGRYVHLMLPGMRATQGWCDAAMDRIESEQDVVGAIPRVMFEDNERLCWGMGLSLGGGLVYVNSNTTDRLAIHGAFPGTEFYRLNTLLQLGGWDENIHPQLAGIELLLRCYAAGEAVEFEPSCQMTCENLDAGIRLVTKSTSHFALTRDVERLYLYARRLGLGRVTAHMGTWMHGFAQSLSSGKIFAEVAGRIAGRLPMRKKNAALDKRRKAA